MASQVESDSEVGVATLIGGIVQDARELFVEQMTLFQVEIKNDFHRTLAALAPLMCGAGVLLMSILLLGFGSAHFLVWAVPDMPLWVAFGIVGGIGALAGGTLILVGRSMLNNVIKTPNTALKGLKENLQWKTKK